MGEIMGNRSVEEHIASFKIIPSDGGRFEFEVDGELLFSKKELGRHADPGEISGLLKEHLKIT